MLGRLHGVPTPANALMQRVANEQARAGAPPQVGPGRDPARPTRRLTRTASTLRQRQTKQPHGGRDPERAVGRDRLGDPAVAARRSTGVAARASVSATNVAMLRA